MRLSRLQHVALSSLQLDAAARLRAATVHASTTPTAGLRLVAKAEALDGLTRQERRAAARAAKHANAPQAQAVQALAAVLAEAAQAGPLAVQQLVHRTAHQLDLSPDDAHALLTAVQAQASLVQARQAAAEAKARGEG